MNVMGGIKKMKRDDTKERQKEKRMSALEEDTMPWDGGSYEVMEVCHVEDIAKEFDADVGPQPISDDKPQPSSDDEAQPSCDDQPQQSSDGVGRVHKVFLVTEVLAMILIQVDARELLRAQRTCRLWYNVVATDPRIQEHLFFKKRTGSWTNIVPNPMLERVMENPKIGLREQQLQWEAPENKTNRKGNKKIPFAQWYVLHITWDGPAPKSRPLVYARQKKPVVPSWRRMLMCQPDNSRPNTADSDLDLKTDTSRLPLYHREEAKFRGADLGPWTEDQFAFMAPYLRIGYVFDKGVSFTKDQPSPLAVMRLSWGPLDISPPMQRSNMLQLPSSFCARMFSTDREWKGCIFSPRWPYAEMEDDHLEEGEKTYKMFDLVTDYEYSVKSFWEGRWNFQDTRQVPCSS